MSTAQRVLDALRESAGSAVSGEALAREIGVSRAAVGKHIARLRADGYAIESAAGTGYRLVGAPDLPLPAEIEPLLSSRRWRITGRLETASTNDDARRLASAGEPEGAVVVAARQTAGRGRFGRGWDSPQGGVYLSAVLRPPVSAAEVGSLALAVGLGVALGLERLGLPVALKWPNDVLLDDRKLAGILLEMSAEADRVEWVVAGIGINVHRGTIDAPSAGFARDHDDSLRSPQVAAAVLDGIDVAYGQWLDTGFAPLLAQYEQRLSLMGRHVEVRGIAAELRAAGVVEGVDADGRLLVCDAEGLHPVASGEATLRSDTGA